MKSTLVVLLFVLLGPLNLFAQQNDPVENFGFHLTGLDDAASTPVIVVKKPVEKHHKFFNLQNGVEFLAMASIAADGYTTIWNGGRTSQEFNPVLNGHKGSPGYVSGYFAGSAAALGTGNYLLRNHPRLRMGLNIGVTLTEAYWVNYNISHHRR